jgi:non-ribosomal peptide synthetase component F
MELYQALSSGAARLDGQVDPPYSRFVLWQRQWLTSTDADRQRSYWANRLKDPPAPLDLGGARDRPRIQRFAGRTEMLRLPREIVEALTAAARHHRKSLFSVMLAAFALLIKQQTGRTEFCIGTAMANRRAVPDAEAIMGMLVNAVVLRLDLRGAMNFQEVLQHVTAVTTEALDNQEYPFELVVRDIRAPRSLSHNPLFQVAFGFHDAPMGDLRAQGISLHPDEGLLQNGSAKFDLNVVVIPKVTSSDGGEEMRILWEYNTVLFSAEHMTGLAERYERSVLEVARHGEPTSL